jgi:choline dehydrogenase-like flavoprotein
MGPATFYKGYRTTARTAYLSSKPANLTIKVNTIVSGVIFDGSKRATGVKTLDGQTFHAIKDVILSAGSIDTPKILLLSGIGPAPDLSALSIPIIQNLSVGQNLTDHCFVTTTLLVKPHVPVPIAPEDAALITLPCPMAWLSSPAVKESSEFAALDGKTKEYFLKVPSFEYFVSPIGFSPLLPPLADSDAVLTFGAVVMNAQSTGTVKLASADPTLPPLIDANYLSHHYDRRVVIEALRSILEYSEAPTFAAMTQRRIEGPSANADDESLWEHSKKTVSPVWHFASTCKMGKDVEEISGESVVDTKFRVRGVKGLKVVDLSVAAVLPNNHTQSTGYLIGETAAEMIIAEYGL